MITRLTLIYFLIAAGTTAALIYSIRDERQVCLDYGRAHAYHPSASSQQSTQDGHVDLAFEPCDWPSESTLTQKLLVLLWFCSGIAFLDSLIRSLLRWLKRRRADGAPAT